MCGIFGAVGDDLASIDVEAALARIAHRGPDGQGIHRTAGAVLGHRRLAVIDLSPAGVQPMVDGETGCALTFNGEIYNHHDLRRELEARGHRFRSRTDSEAILRGYVEWGDGVVERLEGMFAFGIWDPRTKRLLLARDRTGEKPLFYTQAGGVLRFASEIKALLASGVRARPDVTALPMLLTYGYVPESGTMYEDVLRLEPGHLAVFENGLFSPPREYWRPPFAAPPRKARLSDLRAELRGLVERAVASRLEADVPLGAFLSGGIDSTILVGVMSRVLGRKVKTFSIGFHGDPRFDETAYARIASRAFDTEHVEFELQPASIDLVERLVDFHDGPFGDSSAIPTSVVSMLARHHVTVALSGDGGDELFCGYPRFLAAEATERVPIPIRRWASALTGAGSIAPGDRRLLARARRFASVAAQPLPERLVQWCSVFGFELSDVLRPDVADELSLDAPVVWAERILARSEGARPLARVLDHNFHSYLPYDLLPKSDRCSMAHSLEVRSPFLDTALIEFAARLPDETRRRGLDTKVLFKSAFADILPPEIRGRGKMGFGMPLGTWFRNDLASYLEDRFAPGACLYEWIDEPYVRRHLAEHRSGRADHGHKLWLLLTLEVWLRSLRSAGVGGKGAAT